MGAVFSLRIVVASRYLLQLPAPHLRREGSEVPVTNSGRGMVYKAPPVRARIFTQWESSLLLEMAANSFQLFSKWHVSQLFRLSPPLGTEVSQVSQVFGWSP